MVRRVRAVRIVCEERRRVEMYILYLASVLGEESNITYPDVKALFDDAVVRIMATEESEKVLARQVNKRTRTVAL